MSSVINRLALLSSARSLECKRRFRVTRLLLAVIDKIRIAAVLDRCTNSTQRRLLISRLRSIADSIKRDKSRIKNKAEVLCNIAISSRQRFYQAVAQQVATEFARLTAAVRDSASVATELAQRLVDDLSVAMLIIDKPPAFGLLTDLGITEVPCRPGAPSLRSCIDPPLLDQCGERVRGS